MLSLLFPKRHAGPFDNIDDSKTFFSGGPRAAPRTLAGVGVNEEAALTLAAWWCGCRVLAEAVGSLPLLVYERDGENRQPAVDLPLFDRLWRSPNDDMPSGPFREGRMLHQINYGNGFAEIEWDNPNPLRRTQPVALWPIHAARVRRVQPRYQDAEDYAAGYRYSVTNDDNSRTLLKADEMLHVPGIFPDDGIWGKSAVHYHRETIGAGLGIEQFGATSFGSGGMPRAVAKGLKFKNPEQRAEWRKEWKELHGNPGEAEVAILPDGAEVEFLTHMTHENAQFLQTRAMNKRQVAAILRVPSYMLEEYEKAASYASIEQRSIDFVVYSLLPWLRRWEEQCNLKLLLPSQRAKYFVEFQLAGLLRGDFASRMLGYVQALQNGIMTVNEVRRLENLNSIGEAGDENYIQTNMTTVKRMASGEVQAGTAGASGPKPPLPGKPPMPPAEDGALVVRELVAVRPNGVQLVLADAFSRVLTQAANTLGRASEKVTDVGGWVASYFSANEERLLSILEAAAAIRGCQRHGLLAEAELKARADLCAAFDSYSRAKFAAHLETWPKQAAAELAAKLTPTEQTNGTHA